MSSFHLLFVGGLRSLLEPTQRKPKCTTCFLRSSKAERAETARLVRLVTNASEKVRNHLTNLIPVLYIGKQEVTIHHAKHRNFGRQRFNCCKSTGILLGCVGLCWDPFLS